MFTPRTLFYTNFYRIFRVSWKMGSNINQINYGYVDENEWHLRRFNKPDFHETVLLIPAGCYVIIFWDFLPVCASIEWSFQFRHAIQHCRKNEIIILSIGHVSRWKLLIISYDSFLLLEPDNFASCQSNWISHGSSELTQQTVRSSQIRTRKFSI